MPQKTVNIAGRSCLVAGLSDEDPYFRGIGDVFGDDLCEAGQRFLRPDSNCWDIGANIGLTALTIARLCPAGRHVALEPNGAVFDLLNANLRTNDISNIATIRACAGPTDGTARFNENSAFGHIATDGVEVDMLSPASLLARHGVDRLDFIKIDIEGFEFDFLRNAEDIIQRHRPVVHLEFNSLCIILTKRENPLFFYEWILATFPHIYRVGRNGDPNLTEVTSQGTFFLHDHLVFRQSIDDLVCSFAPL